MSGLPASSGSGGKRLIQSSLESLKSTRGFLALYRQGKWHHGSLLSLGWMPSLDGATRIGIRTKKGLKTAVIRNRLKRQLRAAIKSLQLIPREPVSILLVLHPRQTKLKTESLTKELCQLFQSARLL